MPPPAIVRRRIPIMRKSQLCPSGTWLIAAWLLASLWRPDAALASEVTIPLNIDYVTLAEAFKHQVYDGTGGRAELWTGSNKCQYLYAHRPRFERKEGSLILGTDADLSLGMALAGKCVTPITWSGIIETETHPYVGADLAIKFHVIDVNLYNSAHQKTVLLHGFDLIKGNFVPKIEDFSYDLREPMRQLEDLMQAAAAPDVIDRVKTAVATMRPLSAVVPADDGLKLTLELDVPETPTPERSAPAAALSPAELAAFQNMLDEWDAFIVFAIKQLGGAVGDKQFRAQLFDLLLDSRYRLVAALAEPQTNAGPDPIRLIFIDEWTRLRSIIQAAARREMLGSRALEFLSFVTAGDALFAADQAAPSLGMHISEEDLRQLAHMMAPQYAADPLAFSYDADPELQQLFGFAPPLESPGPPEAPAPETTSSATPAATATGAPTASPVFASPTPAGASPTPAGPNATATPTNASPTPAGPSATATTAALRPTPTNANPTPAGPSATPTPASTAAATPSSTIVPTPIPTTMGSWLRWFAPREANASEDPLIMQIFNVGAALKRVVVDSDNAGAYSRSIQSLLTLITQREISAEDLQPQYRRTYLILMKSTAWQESCWRQFIRVDGRIRYLESTTEDIGLMQVNKRVWRGFYSIPRLEWDIVYNAGAGAQILMRLMSSNTARASASREDSVAEIARSTYSAYNGGPNAYHRWHRPDEAVEERDIDESFWTKFRAVSAGHLFDILSCAAQWGHGPVAGPNARPAAVPH